MYVYFLERVDLCGTLCCKNILQRPTRSSNGIQERWLW